MSAIERGQMHQSSPHWFGSWLGFVRQIIIWGQFMISFVYRDYYKTFQTMLLLAVEGNIFVITEWIEVFISQSFTEISNIFFPYNAELIILLMDFCITYVK